MLIQTSALKPSNNAANNLQRDLHTNGYVVIRNILTPDQVQALRHAMKKHLKSFGWCNYGGKFHVQAMNSISEVANIMASDSIVRSLKEITHPVDVLLTGECDIMINTTSTWHKDITHHPLYLDGRIFNDESFRVYKIAFYLQDQDQDSRATLKVKPKSHLMEEGGHMPIEKAAVRAGDAVVFDVRIDHLGQLPTVTDKLLRRTFERLAARLHIDAQKSFTKSRSFLRFLRRSTSDRMAVFLTFGPSEEWTRSYGEACQMRYALASSTIDQNVISRLEANGVTVMRNWNAELGG